MESKIIAFSGAHGTGKTTSVYDLAARYKINGISNGNVGIILETARLCPFPVLSKDCPKPSPDAQIWIFAKQLQAEAEACSRYDLVISDRTLVDCIAYTRHFGYYTLAESMEHLASTMFHRYHQIVFKNISENDFLIDDGVRALDRPERSRIERIMLSIYKRLGIKPSKVPPEIT